MNGRLKKFRDWINGEPLFGLLQAIAESLDCELYLTGGLIRDRLLDRPTQDIDLAVSGRALDLAEEFARRSGGTFVLLKQQKETARVVLPGLYFDFAGFRAPTLEEDQRDRDFTINSLALSLAQAGRGGAWELLDPLSGIHDLQQGIIRHCRPDCFSRDPLRLLRAYRLAGQLTMTLAPETRLAVRTAGPALNRSAPERRHYEWILLLSLPAAAATLALLDEDGLLDILFPEMIPQKKTGQNGFHHLNVHAHSLRAFQCLEEVLSGTGLLPPPLEKARDRYLENGPRLPWLKWAVLVHDLGKPAVAAPWGKRTAFHGHDQVGQELFESIAERLRVGAREKAYILRLIGAHMRPFQLLQLEAAGTLTRRARLRFVQALDEDLTGVCLMALADSLAASGPEKPPDQEIRLIRLWEKSLHLWESTIRPPDGMPALVTGRDLIRMGLTPGPMFKTILARIREEQWLGNVARKEEALDWIESYRKKHQR